MKPAVREDKKQDLETAEGVVLSVALGLLFWLGAALWVVS